MAEEFDRESLDLIRQFAAAQLAAKQVDEDVELLNEKDAYAEQPADDMGESIGPSLLYRAVAAVSRWTDDRFIQQLSAIPERNWTDKQTTAAWLMLQTNYKDRLISLGYNPKLIERPDMTKHKVVFDPIKRLTLDTKSMGFVLQFRYLDREEHDRVSRMVRNIVGRQYHDGTKPGSRMKEPHWVIPGDAPSVASLYQYLVGAFTGIRYLEPERIEWEIEDGVAERMQFIVSRASRMTALSAAHSTEWKPRNTYVTWEDLPLFPYQIVGIEYILAATEESRLSEGRAGVGVYNADPMGMGKTAEAIVAICEAWELQVERNPHLKREDLRTIVLCPAAVKINWSREVQMWTKNLSYTVQILRGRHPQPIWGNFVVVNPQLMKKEYNKDTGDFEPNPVYTMILAQKWFAAVADEAHQYKNWKSQRTSNALELFSGQRWNSRRMRFEYWRLPIPMRIMLSGSPILNRPEEYSSQLQALGILDFLGGQSRFYATYCHAANSEKLRELNEKLRERGYLRREKEDMVYTPFMRLIPFKNVPKNILDPTWVDRNDWEDILESHGYTFVQGVLGQLPDKIKSVQLIEPTNRREIQYAEKMFLQWYKEHVRDFEDADARVLRAARNEALVRINKLKQLTARGKVKPFISWINSFMEETEDENGKLVVYIDHRENYDELRLAFPDSAGIVGGQSEDVRQANIDRFQEDEKCRLIICMLTAGGIGITLTAASHLAFLELGWTPAIHDQAEDRIWGRVNDLHGASIYYFLAPNTIDQRVAALIDSKRQVVTSATTGSDVSQDAEFSHMLARWVQDIEGSYSLKKEELTVEDDDE